MMFPPEATFCREIVKCDDNFDYIRQASATWSLFFVWTPLCVWYVVGCGSKNGYQKDAHLKEIGLRVQNMIIVMGSIINMFGETYMTT